jgi:lipoprotein NlpI
LDPAGSLQAFRQRVDGAQSQRPEENFEFRNPNPKEARSPNAVRESAWVSFVLRVSALIRNAGFGFRISLWRATKLEVAFQPPAFPNAPLSCSRRPATVPRQMHEPSPNRRTPSSERTLVGLLSGIALLLWLCAGTPRCAAAPATAEELLRQANDAARQGRFEEALNLATTATEQAPTNAQAWLARGRLHEARGNFAAAISDLDRALALNPRLSAAWQTRGVARFKAGRFAQAVADFDEFIKLAPEQAPHHWQRGIALYYAGRYDEGRRQFELHQTVNPNDVENAAWHFLCVARLHGLKRARAALLSVQRDPRVPMREILELFAGKATPEQVLAAARAGDPPPARLKEQLFYAHLYVGLFHEAAGEKARAREHITKAAQEFRVNHYMGDVARVHAARFDQPAP